MPTGTNHRELEVLTAREARIVKALAETIMPRDGALPLGAEDVDAVKYLDDILLSVPLKERTLMRCMFVMFDVQMFFTRPWVRRRFSKAPLAERTASLQDWDRSELYFRRAAFQALRSLILWAYVDHPDVAEHIGVEPGTDITNRRQEALRRAVKVARAGVNGHGMAGTVAAPDPILARLDAAIAAEN